MKKINQHNEKAETIYRKRLLKSQNTKTNVDPRNPHYHKYNEGENHSHHTIPRPQKNNNCKPY